MRLQGSNKSLLFCLLILLQAGICRAQEVLGSVRMERVTQELFRVHYQLKKGNDLEVSSTQLKIYRRRKGKVEELFSSDITGQSHDASNGEMIYSWVPPPGTIESGDQLQAKISLHYDKIKPLPGGKNHLPVANAGPFREIKIPLASPLKLDGSASVDADGRISSYHWKQMAGPSSLELMHADSSVALINKIDKEGTYAFELRVRDAAGAEATDRLVLTVTAAPPIAIQPESPVKTQPVIKDSVKAVLLPPAIKKTEPVQARLPLKGGPSNALVNLLVPGLGHYFVSGDFRGNNRKKWPFAITALYAGAAGGTVYFLMRSDHQYQKYKELAAYREYQHDANGNVIGVRGGNEAEANAYYTSARQAQNKARLLAGVGAGIIIADFGYTLWKGSRNQSQWKKQRSTTGFFLQSTGSDLMAGLRIKF